MSDEAHSRKMIDAMLADAGWQVQDHDKRNLSAGLGVAVREYPLGTDRADYVLFIESQPVGVVEAKRHGHPLIGVEPQSDKYLNGLHEKFPSLPFKPPFSYETTGIETKFADRRDPCHRSRHVFAFHRPEMLLGWLREAKTLRERLKEIPKLDYQNLWACQFDAIVNLEESFTQNRPRALIQMATGSGKTFTAVTSIYRLIKHTRAKRVLFLVDRANLGRQAMRELQNYETPDDGRKFTDLYNVQLLSSHKIDPASKVVISTIQRMYSVLRVDDTYEDERDEVSAYEQHDATPVEVQYNPDIPIGEFDFIVIDECHRSIYNKWKQVLDYFDSFLVGLTATPSNDTIGFFHNNQVMRYTHERAVADGVNVGYHVYRIKTRITEGGGTVEAGQYVERRDRLTRKQQQEQLDEDLIYEPHDLGRTVVARDQIRLVARTFKERLSEIFPGRSVVPKTLIFAKNDSHAEDITEIVREEFGRGNDFCKKITYRSKEKPEEMISSFRNSSMPRIAVTVDMIATGTDIKPLECIVFMRDVRSENYFDQMKGRGTRTINADDLMTVTPDAGAKTHFVIVDAVGVCEHTKSDTHSLAKKPGISFKNLMDKAVDKNADFEDIESMVYRLSMLNRRLTQDQREEIANANDGKTLADIQKTLLDGIDADARLENAKKEYGTENPTNEQIRTVGKKMIDEACRVFDSHELRDKILDIKRMTEQTIDTVSIDELLEAGFVDKVQEIDKNTIKSWKEFVEKNRDKIAALDIIYSKPYRTREITFSDIKDLVGAIEKPPYNLTPDLLWGAYQRLDKSRVTNKSFEMLTDLISVIRYSSGKQDMLAPFTEVINEKFEAWLAQQESSGRKFTPEQEEWLAMIKNAIASSVSINLDAIDDVPFNKKGGRMRFYEIFGEEYESILAELNEVLVNP